MLGVKVPAYIFMGDSVQLFCDYDMQMDKLYSVTWYKDNEEFYRYVPTSKHLKHSFSMDGITVDLSISYFMAIQNLKLQN
jgi:cell adhesion molecule 2